MKTLFYLEPFPIRNSHTNFTWIKDKLLSLCGSINNENFKIFSNTESLDILLDYSPFFKNYLLYPFDEDAQKITNMLTDWNQESIKSWKDLMNSEGEITRYFVSLLELIKNTKFDFDVIVNWAINGAVLDFAKKNSVVPVSIELGFLREPFMSSIMFDDGGLIASKNYSISVFDLIESGYKGIDSSEAQILFAGRDEKLNILHESKYLVEDSEILSSINSNKKIALIPLQLEDDSNIINSRFLSVRAYLQEVLPKLLGAGYYCIVKTHPKYVNSDININSCSDSKDYCNSLKSEDVLWFDKTISKNEYVRLLGMSDIVVTVNSSVGFEAAMLDKKVAVLGNAPYKIKDVFLTIEEIINDDYDKEQYLKNLSILREYMLFYYLINAEEAFKGCLFFERIKNIVYIYKSNLDKISSLKLIKSLYVDRNKLIRRLSGNSKNIYQDNQSIQNIKSKLKKSCCLSFLQLIKFIVIFRKKSEKIPCELNSFNRSFSTKISARYNFEIWYKKLKK